MAQQQQTGQRPTNKRAVVATIIVIAVVLAIVIPVALTATPTTGTEPSHAPAPDAPDTNRANEPAAIDPVVITSVTLGTDGNVVISFEQSNPGFVPSFKLYRASQSFSAITSATFIKIVTVDLIDPADKKIIDFAPPAGTLYYGITVMKPLGLGMGYAAGPLSNVLAVAIGSTGPGSGTQPEPTPPPTTLAAPSLLDVSDMTVDQATSDVKATIMVMTGISVGTSAKLYVYASTVEITPQNCGATFIGEITIPAGNALITASVTIPSGFKQILTGYVAIRTVDGTSISPLSNLGLLKWAGNTLPTTVPVNLPDPPTNVRLVEVQVGILGCYVTLEWDASPNAVSYEVWDYQLGTKLTPTSSVYGTSQFYSLTADHLYSLEVRSVNFAGTSIKGTKYENLFIWESATYKTIRYIPISSIA